MNDHQLNVLDHVPGAHGPFAAGAAQRRGAGHAACRRITALLLMLLAALGPGPLAGGEAAGHPDDPPVDAKAEALANLAIGKRALLESNDVPARAVEAALALVKALHYFQSAGDTDMICELDADIFWCKKRMNLDEMRRFLAAKGGSAQDAQLIAEADQLVAKQVGGGEAQGYLERADRFAQDHPADYAHIATRYFEVAERFPGTELGTRAQKLSLEAQKQLGAVLQKEHDALFETVFSRPPPPPAAGRLPVPPSEAQRTAASELKKRFKDDYAIRRSSHKRHFAATLLNAAADAAAAAELRYACFDEAATQALEAKDYLQLLAIAESQASSFAVDVTELKLLYLNRDHGNPVAAAMVKLITAPADKDANLVAGKYCALELERWDAGAPMLARSGDAGLAAVAAMELVTPAGAMQQVELADRWSELSMKTFGPTKEEMLARSYYWYGQSWYNLSGITQERISKRIEETGDLMTPTRVNTSFILTARQWDRLPAKPLVLTATRGVVDTGLELRRGMRAAVFLNWNETWTMTYSEYTWPKLANVFEVNGYGYDLQAKAYRHITGTPVPNNLGAVLMSIGNGPANYTGYLLGNEKAASFPYEKDKGYGLSGLGRVALHCCLTGSGTGKGQIRVKVVMLEDD